MRGRTRDKDQPGRRNEERARLLDDLRVECRVAATGLHRTVELAQTNGECEKRGGDRLHDSIAKMDQLAAEARPAVASPSRVTMGGLHEPLRDAHARVDVERLARIDAHELDLGERAVLSPRRRRPQQAHETEEPNHAPRGRKRDATLKRALTFVSVRTCRDTGVSFRPFGQQHPPRRASAARQTQAYGSPPGSSRKRSRSTWICRSFVAAVHFISDRRFIHRHRRRQAAHLGQHYRFSRDRRAKQ